MALSTDHVSEFTFKDAKDRIWNLELDLGTARRIDKSDFKLYYTGEFSFIKPEKAVMSALISDNSFMFAIIWAIVFPRQVIEKFLAGTFTPGEWIDPYLLPSAPGAEPLPDFSSRKCRLDEFLSSDNRDNLEYEFATSIKGQSIIDGRTAFWGSLQSFFHDQKTVLDVLQRQHQRLIQKIDAAVVELEPEIQTNVDSALAKDMSKIKDRMQKMAQES